jgi:hypothetical protein
MTEPIERRKDPTNQATAILIHELADQVRELKQTVDRIKTAEVYGLHVLEETIERAVTKVMSDGFPDGDAVGHRKAHEQWLVERDARRAMWEKVRSGLLEKFLWSLVIGLGILVTFYFSGVRPK